jgi:hypothetical protein
MKLVLIRGLPGSGKSTMAQALCHSPDWVHQEADMFWMQDGEYKFDATRLSQAHGWCQAKTREALAAGCDVVVTNTFTTVKELEPYFEIAQEFGIVPNVFVAQNDFGSVHNVPAETLSKMRARFAWDISSLYEKYKPVKVIRIVDAYTLEVEDDGHPCPYRMEIHNDYDTLCHCSDEEQHQCAMDV